MASINLLSVYCGLVANGYAVAAYVGLRGKVYEVRATAYKHNLKNCVGFFFIVKMVQTLKPRLSCARLWVQIWASIKMCL